jgi:hypothetical protein
VGYDEGDPGGESNDLRFPQVAVVAHAIAIGMQDDQKVSSEL